MTIAHLGRKNTMDVDANENMVFLFRYFIVDLRVGKIDTMSISQMRPDFSYTRYDIW
jgi:hypothetical protein